MKRILSACLEQTLIFDNRQEMNIFQKQMENKRVPFLVKSVEELPDGTVSVRALRRYIHYPVGEYMKRGNEL